MTQKGPQRITVKMDAVAVGLVRFDLERFNNPHGYITDDEERDQFTARFAFLQFQAIAAAS